jgi:hypothetical protein
MTAVRLFLMQQIKVERTLWSAAAPPVGLSGPSEQRVFRNHV